MAAEILMPKLGLTMTEGILQEWRVAPGDAFSAGQVLFVVETDKTANEIEAQADGVLAERLVEEGAIVHLGAVLAELTSSSHERERDNSSRDLMASAGKASTMQSMSAATLETPSNRCRTVASPASRRLAR